ncbi:hypothetical protein AXF42_Ash005489 [Apostasia shenzhenica]|uniref:DUF8039 domain-containing protein n=1 Tax=Apostasia shenzhenica TaxID=1088818 RepID=A0A2I0B715_9ASPA|nr:hypothetical protein AXF42_Ash005489 [Apostasia shenzhenica]
MPSQEAANQILELATQSSQGVTHFEGRDDEVSRVLGQEHPGRVRAGGRFETITTYFKDNRRGKGIARNAEIQELRTEMSRVWAEMAKMRAAMNRWGSYGAYQASHHASPDTVNAPIRSMGGSDVDMSPSQPPPLSEGSPCLIASMQPNNIVARGRVINPGGSGVIVHNVPLGHGICSVSIDHVIDSSAPLSFPINECYTIGQAIEYIVPWPLYLISHDNQKKTKNVKNVSQTSKNSTMHRNQQEQHPRGIYFLRDHWMLAVLDPYSLLVYWMDPIGHKIRKDLHAIINT